MTKQIQSYNGMISHEAQVGGLLQPWMMNSTPKEPKPLSQQEIDARLLDKAPVVYCTGWTPPTNA